MWVGGLRLSGEHQSVARPLWGEVQGVRHHGIKALLERDLQEDSARGRRVRGRGLQGLQAVFSHLVVIKTSHYSIY